jgi:hypothetical protein
MLQTPTTLDLDPRAALTVPLKVIVKPISASQLATALNTMTDSREWGCVIEHLCDVVHGAVEPNLQAFRYSNIPPGTRVECANQMVSTIGSRLITLPQFPDEWERSVSITFTVRDGLEPVDVLSNSRLNMKLKPFNERPSSETLVSVELDGFNFRWGAVIAIARELKVQIPREALMNAPDGKSCLTLGEPRSGRLEIEYSRGCGSQH